MSRFFPTACSGSGDWGAAGFKAGDRGEVGLWFLRAGIAPLAVNPGAPIPVDPFTLFESGKIIIDRVFRICMQGVVEGRDLTA